MDINALLQALGLSPVSTAQAAGTAAGGFKTPQMDYNRIQKLLQFLRQSQTGAQFDAAKGAIQQTGQDVQGMVGQAGQEVSPFVKGVYQRMNQGALPLGSAFNAVNLAPASGDLLNKLLPGLLQGGGPQG